MQITADIRITLSKFVEVSCFKISTKQNLLALLKISRKPRDKQFSDLINYVQSISTNEQEKLLAS